MDTDQYSVVPLVKLWERYIQECWAAATPPDLTHFAGWMLRQPLPGLAGGLLPETGTEALDGEKTGDRQYQKLRLLDKIGMLIWRISRFMRMSFKQHFEEHPLQSIDEFSLLAGAHYMQQPTKTQLFQHDLLETTTGIQMLARLTKQGLTEETTDLADRRQKRVTLTADGQTVYEQAAVQMDRISDDLFAILSNEELEQLESLLMRLNQYHTNRTQPV